MSFNRAGSFFSVPETPPAKMGEKAEWESAQAKVTLFTPKHDLYQPPNLTTEELRLYNSLMADTSSESDSGVHSSRKKSLMGDESDSGVKTPRKMTPEELNSLKRVTGKTYESDSSVEILNNEDIQKFEKKMTEKSERSKKRINQLNFFREQEKNKKVKMFVPALVDARLIYVRNCFVGADKYLTMRTVDKNGVIYQRVILKDGSVAHNFVVSTDQLLFKIDGEMVSHKTPGARGIINITRQNRVPFNKLLEQNFGNEQP